MRGIWSGIAAIAVAGVLSLIAVTPSDAVMRARTSEFDGRWSVTVFTRRGPCDSTSRYPLQIVQGRVLQVESNFDYQVYGAVFDGGGIRVTVNRSGQTATGLGRLMPSKGFGRWAIASGLCEGVWSAIRR